MTNAAQLAIVLAGVLVPAAFVLFVIAVTRRGGEFRRMDGLLGAIRRLHQELHRAFAADKERGASEQ